MDEDADLFRTVFEQSPISTQVFDADGTAILVNAAWEERWGVTLEQISPYNVLQDKQLEARGIMPLIRQAFAGMAVQIPAIRYVPDETRPNVSDVPFRWVTASMYPVRDASNAIVRVVLMHEDITERKLAEEEREQLLQQVQEALRLRESFLSVASHELRTPLTALHLQVQMLRRYGLTDTDRSQRALDATERQVARLGRLINDLLDVSRIEAGTMGLDLAEIDLTELVRDVAHRYGAAAASAESSIAIDAARKVVVAADASRVEQVITNLLSNALRYGAGKPIHVKVCSTGPEAVVIVRDEGPGIAPEYHERIFGRFERVSGKAGDGGMGLGLYISREIALAHRGSLNVRSVPGEGATFILRLPLDLRPD